MREKIGTPEEIIDKKDYNSIFSNIQLILKFNSGFLNELKNLTKEWPSKTSIGAVFVDHLPYIKLYTQCLFLILFYLYYFIYIIYFILFYFIYVILFNCLFIIFINI